MSILVCTLGTSWQVIPEVYGILAPQSCPLYARAPRAATDLRTAIGAPVIDQVWVVTTAGTRGEQDLRDWWSALGQPVPLRLWRTADSDGAAQPEIEGIRDLIHRAVLHAGPDAVLCLSGGRKTMSADLQRAGMAFGCWAMLHVLPPDDKDAIQRLNAHNFATPLPADLATLIRPVLVGRSARSDHLDLPPALTPARFALPTEGTVAPAPEALWRALDARETESSNLLVSYHATLAQTEPHENWRSLYRLPPAQIDRLRTQRVSAADLTWLRDLPKAELHCHLGGILDVDQQRTVGAAVRVAGPDHVVANRLAANTADLTSELYPAHIDRCGLIKGPRGFRAYEAPGDLMGSAILDHPAAVAPYADAIRARMAQDGLAYLELRGSPHKYVPDFLDRLQDALGDAPVRFIWIANRKTDQHRIPELIRNALDARQRLGGFLVGFDLAGDEGKATPAQLARNFADAFRECLPITIHAGEGQPAESIWEAAYHLHADRIGHGLTLADHPDLARRFCDRRIALELCPTSNLEVVGFRDPQRLSSANFTDYPYRRLADLGLPLTINTDNPGISRTTLAEEFITLSRMTTGGISHWEVLGLIKQAFAHAFLPSSERGDLMRRTDLRIFELITKGSTP